MELWIRSQDKRIFKKIEYLEVDEFDGIITDDECNCLGTYATQERALEVLDEIQNILKPKYILDSSSIKPDGDSWVENGVIFQNYNANARIEELSTYVYEMPKENRI